MPSFVTKLTGHSTLSQHSVRVTYKGVREETDITQVSFLDNLNSDLNLIDLQNIHTECWMHLMEQAIQDSIESEADSVQT